MAFSDLYPIKIYSGNNTIGRLNSSRRKLANRIPSNQGNGFQNILAGFRAQNSNNLNKTRGLTIADYRTRPVISKSRCRPQHKPATAGLKNTVTNRFSEHRTPAVINKEPLRDPSLSGQDLKKAEFVESTTTRKAGGLDFTARGGKRQGHAVPQSLRVKPGAKHPVWKTQIPDKTANQQQTILTNRQIIAQNVQKAAAKYNLPPALINAVIRAESNFKAKAVSSAGAQGLMQLMPATAKELGVKNSFDIEQNIDGGAKYLRKMLDRFGGNIRKALAAYNAGPGTVIKYNGRVPYPETRQYVQRVLRFSRQMA